MDIALRKYLSSKQRGNVTRRQVMISHVANGTLTIIFLQSFTHIHVRCVNDFLYWIAVMSELREYLIRSYRQALSTHQSSGSEGLFSWGRPSPKTRWLSGILHILHLLEQKMA